jgi:hypothetical protein
MKNGKLGPENGKLQREKSVVPESLITISELPGGGRILALGVVHSGR